MTVKRKDLKRNSRRAGLVSAVVMGVMAMSVMSCARHDGNSFGGDRGRSEARGIQIGEPVMTEASLVTVLDVSESAQPSSGKVRVAGVKVAVLQRHPQIRVDASIFRLVTGPDTREIEVTPGRLGESELDFSAIRRGRGAQIGWLGFEYSDSEAPKGLKIRIDRSWEEGNHVYLDFSPAGPTETPLPTVSPPRQVPAVDETPPPVISEGG